MTTLLENGGNCEILFHYFSVALVTEEAVVAVIVW
jgi:hypothetical protein